MLLLNALIGTGFLLSSMQTALAETEAPAESTMTQSTPQTSSSKVEADLPATLETTQASVAGLPPPIATPVIEPLPMTTSAPTPSSSPLSPQATSRVSSDSVNANKHIREVTYSPDKIYKIIASQGYTTAVQLGADESIISVNVGDSTAWLVNVQNNVINLKPIVDNPTTNMNVMTDRGSYQFLLTALPPQHNASGQLIRQPDENALFVLKFRYNDNSDSIFPKTGLMSAPLRNNYRYSARGDASVAPLSVYDNGRFTFFDFGDRQDIPAIFMVDRKGNESLVNYHLQGHYIVVEAVGKQFTLRNGNQVASIFNEAG